MKEILFCFINIFFFFYMILHSYIYIYICVIKHLVLIVCENDDDKQMKWYQSKFVLKLDQLNSFYQHNDSIDLNHKYNHYFLVVVSLVYYLHIFYT